MVLILSKSIIVESWYDKRSQEPKGLAHDTGKTGDKKRIRHWSDNTETGKASNKLESPILGPFRAKQATRTSLRLLRSLSPQLHQRIHKRIRTKHKNNNNRRIPPTVVIILEVDGIEIITPIPKLANFATTRRVWINEIRTRPETLHIARQVITARRAIGGIEDRELAVLALHICVEDGEDEHAPHEVVEGVEVVDPVPPERLDLGVGDQHAAEGDERAED
jgi:hypothetical protein